MRGVTPGAEVHNRAATPLPGAVLWLRSSARSEPVAVRRRPFVLAGVIIAAVLTPAAPASADVTSVGGLRVTSTATLTSWQGSTVGTLYSDASDTSGDLTVLGMRTDTHACVTGNPGAAQILRRVGTTWVPEQRLQHPEPVDQSPAGTSKVTCFGEFG